MMCTREFSEVMIGDGVFPWEGTFVGPLRIFRTVFTGSYGPVLGVIGEILNSTVVVFGKTSLAQCGRDR